MDTTHTSLKQKKRIIIRAPELNQQRKGKMHMKINLYEKSVTGQITEIVKTTSTFNSTL